MEHSKDIFKVVGAKNAEAEIISKPSLSFWKDVSIDFEKTSLPWLVLFSSFY